MMMLLAALLWASDPLVGRWIAALDKSKFSDDFPKLREQTLTCAALDGGIRCVAVRVPIQGTRSDMEFLAKYDGQAYPVTGSPDVDSVILRSVGKGVEGTFLKARRPVLGYRILASQDGKHLTITSIDPKTREPLQSEVVYRRR